MEGDAVRGPRKELLRCIDEENVDVVVLGARNISLLEKCATPPRALLQR